MILLTPSSFSQTWLSPRISRQIRKTFFALGTKSNPYTGGIAVSKRENGKHIRMKLMTAPRIHSSLCCIFALNSDTKAGVMRSTCKGLRKWSCIARQRWTSQVEGYKQHHSRLIFNGFTAVLPIWNLLILCLKAIFSFFWQIMKTFANNDKNMR